MNHRHLERSGFTLIEVVLALSILSVGTLAVGKFMVASAVLVDREWRQVVARADAISRLERRLTACAWNSEATTLMTEFIAPVPNRLQRVSTLDTIATRLPC